MDIIWYFHESIHKYVRYRQIDYRISAHFTNNIITQQWRIYRTFLRASHLRAHAAELQATRSLAELQRTCTRKGGKCRLINDTSRACSFLRVLESLSPDRLSSRGLRPRKFMNVRICRGDFHWLPEVDGGGERGREKKEREIGEILWRARVNRLHRTGYWTLIRRMNELIGFSVSSRLLAPPFPLRIRWFRSLWHRSFEYKKRPV